MLMDVDFALVLVVLVAVSGLLWLADIALYASARRQRVQTLQTRYPGWQSQDSVDAVRYEQELPEAQREPVLIEYAKSFFPVLAVVLVLRSFLVEPFQIPSASMVPTLQQGDFILVNKYTYGLRLPVLGTKVLEVNEPRRGDVMVFFPPHQRVYFIKRVIGLPGDVVSYRDKVLYVNGKRIEQTLLAELPPFNPSERLVEETLGDATHQVRIDLLVLGGAANLDASLTPGSHPGDFTVTVKTGHYFMMGDNRDNSADSRYWGQVPEENIVGKAFAIWMHWDSFWSLPSFQRAGLIR